MVVVNLKEKHMSETLTAPVIDPSEFSPEELDEIREQERIIDTKLETFIAHGLDTDEAFKGITESIELQAVENPKAFLAAREKLSKLADEEDPTDAQLDQKEILMDAIDGPFHARTVTKEGVFEPPTPEVRARVERAIAAVRDAESTEGKMARRISNLNASSANLQAYGQAQANLEHARETNDAAGIETYSFAVRHLRKTMDIQSRGTGHTQKELDNVDKWIDEMRAHDPDITDDDPYMKDALRQRAEAQEDLEKVRSMIGDVPGARQRLRNLLKEHPEGIDVVHQLEATHDGHAANADTQKALLKARTKHEEAAAEVAKLQHTLDPGDARIAIAQMDAFTARKAYEKASEHVELDTKNADLLTEIADENALDKIVLEEHEKVFGKLQDLEDTATESLLEWKESKRPIDEHGSYVTIKKIENYLAGLDEKIALAQPTDRFLPHYRQLRNNAFDSYLQVQYSKEFVRTEMYANAGDFEGRHSLAHTPDKGILLERADGDFIIYPDGSYCSVYTEADATGTPVVRRTPRVDADGEPVTTPVLEQIPDPRALVDSATLRVWQAMSTENLQDVDSFVYKNWIESPANPIARAQLEVVSGMLRERTEGDGTSYAMEATYIERYLGVGRDGIADRLLSDGSVAAHMTLFDIEGDWVIHPNGTADLYTPGTTEPISRYAADGTVLNAYGPEAGPAAPLTPEADDDGDDPGDGSGGGGGAPSTPTPTPSAPVAPIRPVRPTPGTVSAAGAAPTPPTPPSTPEDEPAAPKPERRKPELITREERRVINEAVTNALPESVIYASFNTLTHGKVVQVKGGIGIGNENAHKRLETDSTWTEEGVKKYKVAPESIVYIPEDEVFGRLQYRYEPREGQDPDTQLVVDARVPSRVASELISRIMKKPEIARGLARTFYEAHYGPGSWTLLARPPYEQLNNAQLTVALGDLNNKNQFTASNYSIGG
jgi:hypothetical protein